MAMRTRTTPILRMVATLPSATAIPTIDPIFGAIKAHQKAFRGHVEAVRVEFGYEEANVLVNHMNAEQRRMYELLVSATSVAFDLMEGTSIAHEADHRRRHRRRVPIYEITA
jgi:hypothetical protein